MYIVRIVGSGVPETVLKMCVCTLMKLSQNKSLVDIGVDWVSTLSGFYFRYPFCMKI